MPMANTSSECCKAKKNKEKNETVRHERLPSSYDTRNSEIMFFLSVKIS